MKSRYKKLGLSVLVLGAAAVVGCAHSALDQRIDAKLAQEEPIKGRTELRSEAIRLIGTDSSLTEEQRAGLAELLADVKARTDEISQNSLKLRSLLVTDILASSYDEDEVELIKQRLRDLEKSRLDLTFTAVDKANSILGRQAAQHQKVLDDLFMREMDRNNESLH